MQIIIMHWDDVKLQSNSKTVNAPIIARCTGIKGYDAHDGQRKAIMSQINRKNYRTMLSRVAKLPKDFTQINSSNFDVFMHYLENDDFDWIDKIRRATD